MVTIKITTLIDLDVKTTFDLLSSIHKKNYRDAIESGALSIISEADPEKALEMRLAKQEQEISETRQALAQVRLNKELKKQTVEIELKEVSDTEKIRLEKYENDKQALANQVNRHTIDWKVIQNLYVFKSILEAENYITGKLMDDKLIGCEHCKKWRPNETYCTLSKKVISATQTCRNWTCK
jgi:hypothetical protein